MLKKSLHDCNETAGLNLTRQCSPEYFKQSDYREHTAPLSAKLGILDIFQVNALQMDKLVFYYHKQLLPPMFLSLFSTSSQIHGYDTIKNSQVLSTRSLCY